MISVDKNYILYGMLGDSRVTQLLDACFKKGVSCQFLDIKESPNNFAKFIADKHVSQPRFTLEVEPGVVVGISFDEALTGINELPDVNADNVKAP